MCIRDSRIADVAAELTGAVEFAEKASKLCTVSIAHSDCTYEEAAAVFDAGTSHLTHLYNAMPDIRHRKPGPIGAASERENVIAELICDGQHIHPSAVRMAFKLFPGRICLISDALRCCGMPDGQYTLCLLYTSFPSAAVCHRGLLERHLCSCAKYGFYHL